MYAYLCSRHSDAGDRAESLAIEDGYNLHDALSRFNYEKHVSLSQAILKGAYKEDVFKTWLAMQKDLTDAFSQHQVKQVRTVMWQAIMLGSGGCHCFELLGISASEAKLTNRREQFKIVYV